MRLQRIRLSGFKAFTDASLELGQLTFVTGPNGTGKSSVLEAIRFLLGASPRLSEDWHWTDVAYHIFDNSVAGERQVSPNEAVTAVGEFADLTVAETEVLEPLLDSGVLSPDPPVHLV